MKIKSKNTIHTKRHTVREMLFKFMVSRIAHLKKPNQEETGKLQKDLMTNFQELTIDQIINFHLTGHTVVSAKLGKGFTTAKKDAFEAQNALLTDIDHGLTQIEYLDISKDFKEKTGVDIEPTYIYNTLSCTDKNPRFRAAYMFNRDITQEESELLYKFFKTIFMNKLTNETYLDKRALTAEHLFYAGKELHSCTYNIIDVNAIFNSDFMKSIKDSSAPINKTKKSSEYISNIIDRKNSYKCLRNIIKIKNGNSTKEIEQIKDNTLVLSKEQIMDILAPAKSVIVTFLNKYGITTDDETGIVIDYSISMEDLFSILQKSELEYPDFITILRHISMSSLFNLPRGININCILPGHIDKNPSAKIEISNIDNAERYVCYTDCRDQFTTKGSLKGFSVIDLIMMFKDLENHNIAIGYLIYILKVKIKNYHAKYTFTPKKEKTGINPFLNTNAKEDDFNKSTIPDEFLIPILASVYAKEGEKKVIVMEKKIPAGKKRHSKKETPKVTYEYGITTNSRSKNKNTTLCFVINEDSDLTKLNFTNKYLLDNLTFVFSYEFKENYTIIWNRLIQGNLLNIYVLMHFLCEQYGKKQSQVNISKVFKNNSQFIADTYNVIFNDSISHSSINQKINFLAELGLITKEYFLEFYREMWEKDEEIRLKRGFKYKTSLYSLPALNNTKVLNTATDIINLNKECGKTSRTNTVQLNMIMSSLTQTSRIFVQELSVKSEYDAIVELAVVVGNIMLETQKFIIFKNLLREVYNIAHDVYSKNPDSFPQFKNIDAKNLWFNWERKMFEILRPAIIHRLNCERMVINKKVKEIFPDNSIVYNVATVVTELKSNKLIYVPKIVANAIRNIKNINEIKAIINSIKNDTIDLSNVIDSTSLTKKDVKELFKGYNLNNIFNFVGNSILEIIPNKVNLSILNKTNNTNSNISSFSLISTYNGNIALIKKLGTELINYFDFLNSIPNLEYKEFKNNPEFKITDPLLNSMIFHLSGIIIKNEKYKSLETLFA